MSERTVRRCGAGIRWAFRCPRSWDALAATDEPDVRHCGECDRDVHFCQDDRTTLEHARAGHCIAREEPSPSELWRRVVVGRPIVSEEPTAEQVEAQERAHRERGIAEALRAIDDAPRACPGCGYPVPGFRESCYVCARQVGRL